MNISLMFTIIELCSYHLLIFKYVNRITNLFKSCLEQCLKYHVAAFEADELDKFQNLQKLDIDNKENKRLEKWLLEVPIQYCPIRKGYLIGRCTILWDAI